MNNWYLYRHRRLDTNEIFYIGIGASEKYKRAYDTIRRNQHWKNIIPVGYRVEVVAQSLLKEEAIDLEIFLISLYGRRDLGTGSLVNMTDGGDGTVKRVWTDKQRHELRERFIKENPMYGKIGKDRPGYGKPLTYNHKFNISKSKKGKGIKGDNSNAKLVLNVTTGIFYSSVIEAAETCKISKKYLAKMLSGDRKNKTDFIYC